MSTFRLRASTCSKPLLNPAENAYQRAGRRDYYQNDKYIDNIILDLLFRASQKYNVVMTLTKPQRNKIIKQIKEMNDYNSKMDTLLDNIVGPMDTVVKEDVTKKEQSEEEEGGDESDREEIGGDDESEYEYYQIEIDVRMHRSKTTNLHQDGPDDFLLFIYPKIGILSFSKTTFD